MPDNWILIFIILYPIHINAFMPAAEYSVEYQHENIYICKWYLYTPFSDLLLYCIPTSWSPNGDTETACIN